MILVAIAVEVIIVILVVDPAAVIVAKSKMIRNNVFHFFPRNSSRMELL